MISLFALVTIASACIALAYYWTTDGSLALQGSKPHPLLVKTYRGQNKAELVDPRYHFHDDDGDSWSVASAKGHLLDKPALLFLKDDVVLTNHQNGNHLNTQKMQVNLKRHIATSNVRVTVMQGPNTLFASGITADLNQNLINLTPDVESLYVPGTP